MKIRIKAKDVDYLLESHRKEIERKDNLIAAMAEVIPEGTEITIPGDGSFVMRKDLNESDVNGGTIIKASDVKWYGALTRQHDE